MRFLVDCHGCSARKTPLLACEACGAEPQPAEERRAWRQAVHAHHLARLTQPAAASASLAGSALPPPRRVVIRLGEAPAPLALPPALVAAGDEGTLPLSFDWHDRRRLRLLRRSA